MDETKKKINKKKTDEDKIRNDGNYDLFIEKPEELEDYAWKIRKNSKRKK